MKLRIGTLGSPEILRASVAERQKMLGRIADAGLDHVFVADHVSFFGGSGMDGLVNAAILLASNPTLEVSVGVYLLALRHPLPVARQIASICEMAPGRLVMGIGVGGEDRHEIEVCGVDPRTRGRRTDETLAAVRALLGGEPVTQRCEFFEFEDAIVRPAPRPALTFQVGGRSDAALCRTGRLAEGWLGVWCSAKRFREATEIVVAHARSAGRGEVDWRHGMQVWVGCDSDRDAARARLASRMQEFYGGTPFERFERYSPYGSAAEIADFLAPYVEAGCRHLNLMPVADSEEAGVDTIAEVAERLRALG